MSDLKPIKALKPTAMFLLVGCLFLLVFGFERQQFVGLLVLYGVAFGSYLYLAFKQHDNYFYLGLGIRVLLLFLIPNLSEDFYRFLWDGELVRLGMSPFSFLPQEIYPQLIKTAVDPGFISQMYEGMNSTTYYSVYPPISQWLFCLASMGGNVAGGVFILKLFILLAEIGVYFVLKRLLNRFSKSRFLVNLYWLNPLVIVELMGNCHFEGVMLFFFLMATYQFARLKDTDGAFYFAFSVLSKLFSLMFLPLLMFKMWGKRVFKPILLVFVLSIICFLPFVSFVDLRNVFESFDLYFQRFEFNGSIYYLCRSTGFYFTGFNQIYWIGPLLAGVSLLLILAISFVYRFKNRWALFTGFLLINSVYLFLSPIVHPWYLVMIIGFSVLSHYRFPIVWSGTVFLSYAAYGGAIVQEYPVLLLIEYLVVFIALYLDVKKHFSIKKLKAALIV